MRGAVLRDDGQLEVSRDAVHAWVRLDWHDRERRRTAGGLPGPRKRMPELTSSDGRDLRGALLQAIDAGATGETLLSELERAERGASQKPAVSDDVVHL